MKFKGKILSIYLFSTFFNQNLISDEVYPEEISITWVDQKEVHVSENAFYIETNLGLAALTILEYDEEKQRYLVQCIKYANCLYPTP